jgi:hypothetical protein
VKLVALVILATRGLRWGLQQCPPTEVDCHSRAKTQLDSIHQLEKSSSLLLVWRATILHSRISGRVLKRAMRHDGVVSAQAPGEDVAPAILGLDKLDVSPNVRPPRP